MPKFRCVAPNRASPWFATRREAILAAERLGLTTFDGDTGKSVLREGVQIEKRRD